MGHCQLILQPSEGEYLQEMAAIRQEGETEKKGKKIDKLEEITKQTDEEDLSREWIMENFRLHNNPILDRNPQVIEELIQVL